MESHFKPKDIVSCDFEVDGELTTYAGRVLSVRQKSKRNFVYDVKFIDETLYSLDAKRLRICENPYAMSLPDDDPHDYLLTNKRNKSRWNKNSHEKNKNKMKTQIVTFPECLSAPSSFIEDNLRQRQSNWNKKHHEKNKNNMNTEILRVSDVTPASNVTPAPPINIEFACTEIVETDFVINGSTETLPGVIIGVHESESGSKVYDVKFSDGETCHQMSGDDLRKSTYNIGGSPGVIPFVCSQMVEFMQDSYWIKGKLFFFLCC
jgi:hypothetical protein